MTYFYLGYGINGVTPTRKKPQTQKKKNSLRKNCEWGERKKIFVANFICNGTSDNRPPLLRKPLPCGQDPESFSVVYYTLWPLYSGNLPTPNYGYCSHAQTDKNNTNSLWKQTVSTYWCINILEELSHFYPFYNVSRPLCIQGVLKFQIHGIQRLEMVITLPGALSV